MPLDLEAEIARRLDTSPEAISDVLATVVERIRQQVSYYGYARVAGLGTFRGDEDRLVFEADPTLAEHVNLKFVGLDELLMSSGSPIGDADITEPFFGEPDASDMSESDLGATDELDAEAPIEPEAPADLDADAEWGAVAWEAEEDEDVVGEGEEAGEGEDDREDADAAWHEPEEAEVHPSGPLGPLPPSSTDDAAFSVLDESPGADRDADEDEHDLEVEPPSRGEALDESPSVQWRPINLRPESRQDDHDEELAASAAGFASASRDFDDVESEVGDEDAFAVEDEIAGEDEIGTEDAFDSEIEIAAEGASEEDAVDELDEEGVLAASGSESARGARPHESLRSPTDSSLRHARESARSTGERNRSVIWLGAGVIVLVAIAAVAFFALRQDEVQGPPLAEQTEPQVLPDTSASSAAGDTAAAEMPPAALPEEDAEQEADAADDDSTPLRSSAGIDPSEGGYTIIVYSESSEQRAADVAAQYSAEGFRADVLEYDDDGAMHLRVGVGQFTTLTEAAETRNRLAGNELPDDAWVRRVP